MTDKGKELMKETVENLKKLDKESMMLVKASIDILIGRSVNPSAACSLVSVYHFISLWFYNTATTYKCQLFFAINYCNAVFFVIY